MREQTVGDTVKVRGSEYKITGKERDIYGDRGHKFTLSTLDGAETFRAHGWRVMHNSRLTPVAPAPVEAVPAPAPVKCDHKIGEKGCTLVDCDGVPPLDAPADADRITVPADARPAETGPETLGRAIMVNLVGRLSVGHHVASVSLPTWSSSGVFNHPRGTVRDFGRYALTADGYEIVITYYQSAGHSMDRLSYYAVSVDGFTCDQGNAIKAAQTVDRVAQDVGYAIMRHLELISLPSERTPDYSPNVIPFGATLTPRRIADVQVGDVIRSFSADGHATVTGPVRIGPGGQASVPVERDGDACTLCQDANRTVAIITLPGQASTPVAPAVPAPVADQASTPVEAPPAPVVAFTASRDVLADALAYVATVASKPRIPILGGVLITADESGVRVQTFDYDELRTVRLVGADVTVPGRVLVPCEILTTVAREGLPAGTPAPVNISATGRELLLTWQRYRLTLPTLPVEDFPSLADVAPVPAGTFDMRALADALARVGVAAGKDDTEPVLRAVHVAPAGDALALTTCDRYRVATDQVAWSPVEGVDTVPGANVPARAFIEFGKIAADVGGRVAYGVRANDEFTAYASLTAGAYSLAVHLVEGEFPDLAERVPAAYGASATVDTRALVKVVERVTKGHGKTTDPRKMARVALTFHAGEVTVSGPAIDDAPRPTDTVPVTFNGHDGFTLTVRARHLVAGLKTAGRTALIAFTTSHGMTLTRPADGGDAPAYGYLMPACMASKDDTDTPAGAGVDLKGPTMTVSKNTRTRKTPSKAAPAPAPAPAVEATPAPAVDQAPAPAAPVVDSETVERVAHDAYVAYRDAKQAHAAGDVNVARDLYTRALDTLATGEGLAPGHLVAGKLPWSEIRVHVESDAATLPAPVVDQAPAPAVEAVPAAPAPVEATPAPAPAKVSGRVAITHGLTGTLMVGTPYPLRFKVSALLNAKRGGLGWTFAKDAAPGGAWVLDGSAGQPSDSGKIRAAVDALATLDVAATVAVDGYDADAAPAAPVPSVEPVAVDPATVHGILSRGAWSIATVRPKRGKAWAGHVFTLPAGERLDRDVYTAVKAVMDSLGGTWQTSVKGFAFLPAETVWNGGAGGFTRTGSEKLAAWLASNAPATGDQAAPVAPVEPTPAPVVDPMARLGLVVGQYTRIDGRDGHGAARSVTGYVQYATDTDSKGVRVRVSATPDGSALTVYVDEASRVEHLAAPAPAVEPIPAPAPVDMLTTADIPAPVAPAPADAAVLTVAAVAARAAMDAPAPVADQATASGPLAFTLAPWSAEAGVSYRESRKAVHAALRGAGVAGFVVTKDAGNRRAFTVTCEPVDRARVAAIVAGAVTLAADVPAPVA